MNIKKQLEQIRKIDNLIDTKLSEVQYFREVAYSVTAAVKDNVGGSNGGSTPSDKVGDYVSRIIDTENEINCEIDKLINLRRQILSLIENLDPHEYAVIYKRYFQYKSWNQISEEMFFSRQWVFNVYVHAMDKLERIF